MELQQQHFDKALKEQSDTHKLEQIESRFFELLKIHKDNVNEINLSDKISGRISFEHMYHEFRIIHRLLNNGVKIIGDQPGFNAHNNISEMELLELSYSIFFYGIEMAGSQQNYEKMTMSQRELFGESQQYIQKLRYTLKKNKENNPSKNILSFTVTYASNNRTISYNFNHVPFAGKANKIGHLYRHLFRSCQYILTQEILTFQQKKDYIKILRAQLSNYEQIMIYYNAIVWFKGQWDELFVYYQFIHNRMHPRYGRLGITKIKL